MGSEFTFYDFVDDKGVNQVKEWLHGPGSPARAKLNQWIAHLEALPPGDKDWSRPHWAPLHGNCAGLAEIRAVVSKVKYRLLAFFGPGACTVTIFGGAIEKDNKLTPLNACEQALKRKDLVATDPNKYRREHDVG